MPADFFQPKGVGDINSTEKGTGARYNDGKPPMDLIPVRYWQRLWQNQHNLADFPATDKIVMDLRRFQEGQNGALAQHLWEVDRRELHGAANVFNYGLRKYKQWNWARGMPWSVVTGSCLRHLEKIIVFQEINDDESKLPHLDHVYCNLIMLDWYNLNYLEGDDRPPRYVKTDVFEVTA